MSKGIDLFGMKAKVLHILYTGVQTLKNIHSPVSPMIDGISGFLRLQKKIPGDFFFFFFLIPERARAGAAPPMCAPTCYAPAC